MVQRFTDDELSNIREEIRLYGVDIHKVVRGLCSRYGLEITDNDSEFIVSHILLLYCLVRSMDILIGKIEDVDKKREINEYCSMTDISDILKEFINTEYDGN